jgi:hypothetical protein
MHDTGDLDAAQREKAWNTIIEHRVMVRTQHEHIGLTVATCVITPKRADMVNLNVKRVWRWLDTKIAAAHLTGKAIKML